MILRCIKIVFILLFHFSQGQPYDYLTQTENDNDESGKLEALRSYLERNAEPKLFRSYNRQFEPAYHVEEREAEDIPHRNSFEPEDGEIDAIGKKFIQSEDKGLRSSNSQPEIIPEVVQHLPLNVQKQARAPLNKDSASSLLAHNSERATDKASDIYFIDAIGKKFIQSEDKGLRSSNSQPEIIPEVVQHLPLNVQKQARAPLNKDSASSLLAHNSERATDKASDIYFIVLVAGCSVAGVCGVIAAGFCWYKLQKNAKAAAAADYPAYGVTGPSKEEDMTSPPNGDRKLAQNAHMYHYQHQKQQMIAIEKANGDRQISTSDLDSEEENEDGDYTVYECAGLAPTGEMEVKNPLFQDEPPPPTPPVITKELEK